MNDTYQEITLETDSGDVSFTGRALSETSTQTPGKPRWVELTLYQTESGKFIVRSVGCSNIAGEEDRTTIRRYRNEKQLINQMTRSDPGIKLLGQAGIEIRID